MLNRRSIFGALAAMLVLPPAAYAQPGGLGSTGMSDAPERRPDSTPARDTRSRRMGPSAYESSDTPRRPDNRPDYRNAPDVRDRRGYRPDHGLYRGGRLPSRYRHGRYGLDDWRGHRLSAPPRGHRWVRVGNDYLLVSNATGRISNLVRR